MPQHVTECEMPCLGSASADDIKAAALREFTEKLGLASADLRLLGCHEEELHGARDCVHVASGTLDAPPRPDRREVVEARFLALDELPPRTARIVGWRCCLMTAFVRPRFRSAV